MKAILKGIEASEYDENMLRHPIKMFFVKSKGSDELYHFGTTIEAQFCTTGEYDMKEGLPEEMFNEKVSYANSLIGKTFEINLYKFTVKELTDNKYTAFEFADYYYEDFFDTETIEEYHIASYMSKEDVILNLKYSITMQGLEGVADGVLANESTEEITTELFFPKPIPEEKHFNMPYDKFPNINARYIVNNVPVKDINKGRNLAYQINDRDFPDYKFDSYVHEIEDYRSKVRAAKMENESLKKKLFFWEPKVFVEELKLSPNVISLMKDCIILGKEYPSDCEKADREYAEECEKQLRKQFMGEDADEKDFKNKWIEFRKSLRKKYQGKSVIKVLTEL
jgi:hypothetical protein